MTRLSEIFDGERHELFREEDFYLTAFIVLEGFEEEDELEEPTMWESPSLVPITREDDFSHVTLPGFEVEHGWGVFAMAMNFLCRCLGIEKHQYQHNNWPDVGGAPERHFTFQAKFKEDGSGYQGGRL